MDIVGNGKYTYKVVGQWSEGIRFYSWGKLPAHHRFYQVTHLAVDSQDRIYVFNRNPNHVYVLDREGNFISMWEKEIFSDIDFHSPHGFYISSDDEVYCTDVRDHTVRKFTLDGELLLTLGTEGRPGKPGEPFNKPTDVAISSSGDVFVSDGYVNARVHKFTPDGELLLSWGKPGSGPGEFNLPHGICVDNKDHVWVADRENSRIQIFTTEGEFITQLTDLKKPQDVFIDAENTVYVPEKMRGMSILSLDGELLARWGSEKSIILDFLSKVPGEHVSFHDVYWGCLKGPGQFVGAHDCCVDSKGDLYVGEAYSGQSVTKFIRKRDIDR